MRTNKSGIKVYKEYGSVAELSSALQTSLKPYASWDSIAMSKRSKEYQRDFCGATYEEALELLSIGDPEKAAQIRAEGEILAEKTSGAVPRIHTGVIGCVPCVPNYLRGVPNNMLYIKREPQQKPIIDIYVVSSIYADINERKVAEKAAMLANIITATEQAGVRVNLYACAGTASSYGTDSNYFGFSVKLKEANSPLNLLNIAFCICNKAFCRSISLRWLECVSKRKIGGHGYPMRAEPFKKEFNTRGLVLSVRDLVDYNVEFSALEQTINNYIKEQA